MSGRRGVQISQRRAAAPAGALALASAGRAQLRRPRAGSKFASTQPGALGERTGTQAAPHAQRVDRLDARNGALGESAAALHGPAARGGGVMVTASGASPLARLVSVAPRRRLWAHAVVLGESGIEAAQAGNPPPAPPAQPAWRCRSAAVWRNSRRRVCRYCMGVTPCSAAKMRRRWRSLTPSAPPAPPAGGLAAGLCVQLLRRLARQRGATSITLHGRPAPGAISGGISGRGRNAAASACAGVSKKRQLRRCGVRTRQIGRQYTGARDPRTGAVEARIAGGEGLVGGVGIERHAGIMGQPALALAVFGHALTGVRVS